MSSVMNLLRRVAPLARHPVSAGMDEANRILCEELPFRVHEFPGGTEINGWILPERWEVRHAEIRKNGRVLYDGSRHSLGVAGNSLSFHGTVSREELRDHLFFHPFFPDALVYHCDWYYKPWKRDWGFSVPRTLFESLEPGDYEVDLQTEYGGGTLKVLDLYLPGDSPETIFLNAHSCHPGQANDGASGVVVGVEVFRRLTARKKRRFSYRLVLAPEHVGTVAFLESLPGLEVVNLKAGIFLDQLGHDNPLTLQHSFLGDTLIDNAVRSVLSSSGKEWREAGFREITGNDETVWEAAGYEIPTPTLCRGKFTEYHSSEDTADRLDPRPLEEAMETIVAIFDLLETRLVATRRFRGLVALSNPRYDLYIGTHDPSVRAVLPDDQPRWNRLMDCLPRYFDGKTTTLQISLKHGIDHARLVAYLRRWEEKGLVTLDHAPLTGTV